MELFRQTNIDFMGLRKWTAMFSIVLFTASLLAVIFHGINWSLEFTGGWQVQLSYKGNAPLQQIRDNLSRADLSDAVVQSYGNSHDVLLRLPPHKDVTQQQLVAKVLQVLPGAKLQQSEFVGPQVGKELAAKGFLALLVSFLATMTYLAFRFEYRFAISAILALVHDPVLILGIFSFFHLEFNLPALAALLAVIGYSLNDTIVVFDRVRENFRRVRRGTPLEIMNLSINQTLSRTIMTSVMTLVVVIALFLYGGPTLRGFSAALIIGIVVGTYSSIYVAGSLAVAFGLQRADLLPVSKTELDDRP